MAALTALATLAASTVLPATAAGVAGLGTVALGAHILSEKMDKAGKIPTPKASDPVAKAETGGDELDPLKRRKKRKGRADTIKAGSLIPENVGTKSLLG